MAFARHNIEKRRLIELVRMNPILWDCRLPHYKRSDKKKAIKWNELGRIFNVSGERVQRTFTSLREIFRRELNHEKMLGNRFQSKWEFYEEMTFLREVIRERKSRERSKVSEAQNPHHHQQENSNIKYNSNNINNNKTNSCNNDLDEYQYYAPNDPNNPNNKLKQQQHMITQIATASIYTPTSLAILGQKQQQSLQQQPGVVLSLQPKALSALKDCSTNNDDQQPVHSATSSTAYLLASSTATTVPQSVLSPQQSQQQKELDLPCSPHALSTLHSTSSSPSIYIKDEPDSQEDETISLASTTTPSVHAREMPLPLQTPLPLQSPKRTRSYARRTLKENGDNYGDNATMQVRHFSPTQTAGIGNTTAANTDSAIASNHQSRKNLIIDEDELDDFDGDLEIDEVDDGDIELLDDDDLRTNGLGDNGNNTNGGGVSGDHLSMTSTFTMLKPHQITVREILYTKFGDFLAARLNTLHETVANELMNKILLLVAEK